MKFKRPKAIGRKRKTAALADRNSMVVEKRNLPFVARATPNEPLIITAGPLARIRRLPREFQVRDEQLLDQLGGNAVVRGMASLIARDVPPLELAYVLWCFICPYA